MQRPLLKSSLWVAGDLRLARVLLEAAQPSVLVAPRNRRKVVDPSSFNTPVPRLFKASLSVQREFLFKVGVDETRFLQRPQQTRRAATAQGHPTSCELNRGGNQPSPTSRAHHPSSSTRARVPRFTRTRRSPNPGLSRSSEPPQFAKPLYCTDPILPLLGNDPFGFKEEPKEASGTGAASPGTPPARGRRSDDVSTAFELTVFAAFFTAFEGARLRGGARKPAHGLNRIVNAVRFRFTSKGQRPDWAFFLKVSF